MLFVPATKPRAIAKTPGLDADGFLFDLEDAVLPDAKSEARAALTKALPTLALSGRERGIRINGLGTPWARDDLRAVAELAGVGAVDAVLVPKVEDAASMDEVAGLLERLGAPDRLRVMAMVETPGGVLAAPAIAAAPRVTALVVGPNDLEAKLGARPQPERSPLLGALSMVVLAARAAGVDPIDGVYGALDDVDGLVAECAQGAAMGFAGKTLIHPAQIEPANRAYAPSEAAIRAARATVEGFEAAEARGEGVAVVDGKMVEIVHARAARGVLSIADAIASRRT